MTCFGFFQKRSKAQALLDKVFEHLELVEKDYFGLQFSDADLPAPDTMVSTPRRDRCIILHVTALKKQDVNLLVIYLIGH